MNYVSLLILLAFLYHVRRKRQEKRKKSFQKSEEVVSDAPSDQKEFFVTHEKVVTDDGEADETRDRQREAAIAEMCDALNSEWNAIDKRFHNLDYKRKRKAAIAMFCDRLEANIMERLQRNIDIYVVVGDQRYSLSFDDDLGPYICVNGENKPIAQLEVKSAYKEKGYELVYRGHIVHCYCGNLYPLDPRSYEENETLANLCGDHQNHGNSFARGNWYFMHPVKDLRIDDITTIIELREPYKDYPFETESSVVLKSGGEWTLDGIQYYGKKE